MKMVLLFILPLVLLIVFKGTIGEDVRIANENDFLMFLNNVNSGTSYFGITVFIDSDLSLFNVTEPVGGNSDNQFHGTFDGQGHIIDDLNISTSLQYTGPFGHSNGLTVRNVVLSGSCSITNSYLSPYYQPSEYTNIYVGGIIGYCKSSSGVCTVKNSVNMATISFDGSIEVIAFKDSGILYLGGFIGFTSPSSNSYITNCANYGSVTHSGNIGISYIGGIVGYSYLEASSSTPSAYTYIQNCFNYGAITYSGTTSKEMYLGGIVGNSLCTYIENCLSMGIITSNKNDYIGSIVGKVDSYTTINNCYFTSDTKINKLNGIGTPLNTTGSPSSYVNVNTTLIDNLNNKQTPTHNWNKWILNINSATITFKVNNNSKGCSFSSNVIVLPDLISNSERTFAGWYNDEIFTSLFTGSEVKSNITLYGGWNVTVTLNVNGGNISSFSTKEMIVICDGTYGTLPTPTRYEHNFDGWFTDSIGGDEIKSDSKVTAIKNHTIYAHWTVNQYVLIFDFANGTHITNTVNYDDTITYPENPEKEGYIFNGWDIMITKMPAKNLTITAKWASASKSSSTSVIIGVLIPMFIIIIAAFAIFVWFIFFKKKGENANKYTNINEINYYNNNRKEEFNAPLIGRADTRDRFSRAVSSSSDYFASSTSVPDDNDDDSNNLANLYPEGYVAPTMRNALFAAGLKGKYIDAICNACESTGHAALRDSFSSDGFTEEDATSIAMYTYDFGGKKIEYNPYRIINRSLVERNPDKMQKASGLLYLVMTALRKLPRIMGITLYRGVRDEVSFDEDHYQKGNTITWMALSSTSPDMNETKKFLAKGSKSGKATGTLFIIEGGWGYNIQPYSMFPDEAEILIEPERQFKVVSVIQAEGLTIVNLQMLDTPLSLPEVFGEGKQ